MTCVHILVTYDVSVHLMVAYVISVHLLVTYDVSVHLMVAYVISVHLLEAYDISVHYYLLLNMLQPLHNFYPAVSPREI